MNTDTTIESTLATAVTAAPRLAAVAPLERAAALVAVADALDAEVEQIAATGTAETGLADGRMRGELNRTTQQLRLFAEVVVEGTWLDVRIDEADPDYVVGPRPDLRRLNVALGPVLVFAASNFPLAFSVAGGDTAAALAAGNPVVLKAHDGHPALSELTARIVTTALQEAGMPEGTLSLVHDRDAAVAMLRDDRICAASFTGSTTVGRILADVAASRERPIPFYGELGSVNPVVVSDAALAERAAEIGQQFVGSVSGSCGQLCTKPGFLLVGDADALLPSIREHAETVPAHRQLTTSITQGYLDRRAAVLGAEGVEVVVKGDVQVDDQQLGWATPTIVRVSLATLRANHESLLDETFGPLSVVVEHDLQPTDLASTLAELFPGNLTATLHTAADEDGTRWEPVVAAMARTSGRVLFNGWPTGVSVTAAMQHGGPAPATTTDTTSVGTAAIGRFLRGVCFQDAPASLLPAPVRDDNPWDVPQRRSPAGLSKDWGSLAGQY